MHHMRSFHQLTPYKEQVAALYTTRYGGVSQGAYGSMNLCHYVGDQPEAVKENRQRVVQRFEGCCDHLIFAHQTHGDKILTIDRSFLQSAETLQEERLKGVDALITNCRGCCIGVFTADCVPLLLYDKKHQAIGVVHAGWRGTAVKITVKTVNRMAQHFQTTPADLLVSIAPCISADNYEVGDEIYEHFNAAGFPSESIFFRHHKSGRYHLDLRAANHWLLAEIGIPPHQIEIAEDCTYAESERFFSSRKNGIESGRMSSCIVLKESEQE